MEEDLSYNTIKKAVINRCSQVHFEYKDKYYWIVPFEKGIHLTDDEGNSQIFNDAQSLFEKATIDDKTLEEIWNDIEVDSVN